MSKGMVDKKIKKLENEILNIVKKEIGKTPVISGS